MAGLEGPSRHDETVGEADCRKAERKLEAQGARHRGVWFGLGMFGLVGWSVAVPTLLGIALPASGWTVPAEPLLLDPLLLFIGAVLGSINARTGSNGEPA
ncbi:MAG: hypothetical protein R3D25_15945 [Geminicoccaceae bacterium]